MKIQVDDKETPPENEEPEDEEVLATLISQMKDGDATVKVSDVFAADFEKDDDSNHHIDFINAAANLRARNYRIVEVRFFPNNLV
jgi:ubiquitin-activating enzyme E1